MEEFLITYISENLHFQVISNILQELTKFLTKKEQEKLYEENLNNTIINNYNTYYRPIELNIVVIDNVFVI